MTIHRTIDSEQRHIITNVRLTLRPDHRLSSGLLHSSRHLQPLSKRGGFITQHPRRRPPLHDRLSFVGLAFVAAALPVMLMTVKSVTSTRRGNVALAAAFLVGAVILGAIAASTLEGTVRLREHGLTANATITNVDENIVSLPGHVGWSTTVTVSFTDTSGGLVRAQYTDGAPAGGRKAGQTIQIAYDPASSTSISPVRRDPRWAGVLIIGLMAVVWLGISVYHAYRAWRWREKYSNDVES